MDFPVSWWCGVSFFSSAIILLSRLVRSLATLATLVRFDFQTHSCRLKR